jgi:ribosomal protein S18 acetylase RimI-like enzyme
MPPLSDAAIFARTRAFTRAMDEAIATRAVAHRLGTIIANDTYPHSHSMNFLRVEGEHPDLTAPQLDAAIRAAMDAVDRSHLQAVIEDRAAGARLAVPMRDRGWEATEIVTMAWRRVPERDPAVPAAIVDWEVLRPVVLAGWRADARISDEEVARQLTDRRDGVARATHLRHLVAPAPPAEIGSYADLYSDGATAQIESVNTLEAVRNRGYASALVLHGARTARDEGHDLVFLVADVDDWPRHLYERLGFEEVGGFWEMSRDR